MRPTAPHRIPRAVLAVACSIVLVTHAIASAEPVPAYRVVFEYDRSTIRLRELVPVRKTLPGTDGYAELVAPRSAPSGAWSAPVPEGWWFELRDQAGAVLYHRILRDPRVVYFEARASPGTSEMTRVERVREKGVFSLLIPRHAVATELVVFAARERAGAERARSEAPEQPPREDTASREVARIPIPRLTTSPH